MIFPLKQMIIVNLIARTSVITKVWDPGGRDCPDSDPTLKKKKMDLDPT